MVALVPCTSRTRGTCARLNHSGRDLGRHRYLVGHESVVTEPGEADDEQCSQSENAYRRVPLSAAIRDWWSLDRWSAS
jgi:hypothetical protein